MATGLPSHDEVRARACDVQPDAGRKAFARLPPPTTGTTSRPPGPRRRSTGTPAPAGRATAARWDGWPGPGSERNHAQKRVVQACGQEQGQVGQCCQPAATRHPPASSKRGEIFSGVGANRHGSPNQRKERQRRQHGQGVRRLAPPAEVAQPNPRAEREQTADTKNVTPFHDLPAVGRALRLPRFEAVIPKGSKGWMQ